MSFALGPHAAKAGYRLAAHSRIDSTNSEALRLIRNGERGPLWIVTDRQSEGRGRQGRRWTMAEGNLAATLLLAILCAAVGIGLLRLVPLAEPIAAEELLGLHLRGGVLKSLLKEILADYLPKELVYRGKSGFGLDASFARGSGLEADAQRGFRLLAEAGSIRKETIKNQRATFAAALLYRALKNLGEA